MDYFIGHRHRDCYLLWCCSICDAVRNASYISLELLSRTMTNFNYLADAESLFRRELEVTWTTREVQAICARR